MMLLISRDRNQPSFRIDRRADVWPALDWGADGNGLMSRRSTATAPSILLPATERLTDIGYKARRHCRDIIGIGRISSVAVGTRRPRSAAVACPATKERPINVAFANPAAVIAPWTVFHFTPPINRTSQEVTTNNTAAMAMKTIASITSFGHMAAPLTPANQARAGEDGSSFDMQHPNWRIARERTTLLEITRWSKGVAHGRGRMALGAYQEKPWRAGCYCGCARRMAADLLSSGGGRLGDDDRDHALLRLAA
jgi:hypothetical protein